MESRLIIVANRTKVLIILNLAAMDRQTKETFVSSYLMFMSHVNLFQGTRLNIKINRTRPYTNFLRNYELKHFSSQLNVPALNGVFLTLLLVVSSNTLSYGLFILNNEL